MVKPKTEEEIGLLRENAIIVSKTLAEVGKWVAPGVTTAKLNEVAETFIRDNGAIPSFLGFEGFPAATCMSVNDVVVHGFPSDYVLREVNAETRKLLDVTKASLYKGIEAAVAGARTGDIGHAVQSYVESFGFSVVRELEGHGLGKEMHEAPGVPNFGKRGHGARLAEGVVICIEPMVNAGGRGVYLARNGWAVHTADHRKSAHFELTVVVRHGKAEQLSTFDYIESTDNS